jgi:hypothetical protein
LLGKVTSTVFVLLRGSGGHDQYSNGCTACDGVISSTACQYHFAVVSVCRRAPSRSASKVQEPGSGSSPSKKAAGIDATAVDADAAAAAAAAAAAGAAADTAAKLDIGNGNSKGSVQSTIQSLSTPDPLVAAAPDSPAGEVRLLVSSALSKGQASNVSGSSQPLGLNPEVSRNPAAVQQQQQRGLLDVRSQESMKLAAAATEAAIAAAELARTEADAVHPVAHRAGLLRFMRAREDFSQDDPQAPPAAIADVAAAADTPTASSGGGGPAWGLRQAAAGASTSAADNQPPPRAATGRSSGGGGMAQLVQDMLAAQGKDLQQSGGRLSSSSVGSKGATAGAAAGPSTSVGEDRRTHDVLEALIRKLQRRGIAGDAWHAR